MVKTMTLFEYVPKTRKNEQNWFQNYFTITKEQKKNIKHHFGSFAPDKTGAKKSQKLNEK